MDHISYLKIKLPTLLSNYQHNQNYFCAYTLIKIKRFLIQTILIFVLQFLTMFNMGDSYTILPMYPPIGMAFVIFDLLGKNALCGLLLGELCIYFIKGQPLEAVILYIIADLGCSYIGTILCQNVFSSDLKPFSNWRELCKFLCINALTTCSISTLLRIYAIRVAGLANLTFIQIICLWLSEITAILIFYVLVCSWLYGLFSKEKISNKTLSKTHIYTIIAFIAGTILFIKKIQFIYLIIGTLILSIYYAYLYGYLIGIMLLFIVASIYSSYFIAHGVKYVTKFGYNLYSITYIGLLLYTAVILYVGHYCSKKGSVT